MNKLPEWKPTIYFQNGFQTFHTTETSPSKALMLFHKKYGRMSDSMFMDSGWKMKERK